MATENAPNTLEGQVIKILPPSHIVVARGCLEYLDSEIEIEGIGTHSYSKIMYEITRYDDEVLSDNELHYYQKRVVVAMRIIMDTVRAMCPYFDLDAETYEDGVPAVWEDTIKQLENYSPVLEPRSFYDPRIRVWMLYGYTLPEGGNLNITMTESTDPIDELERQLMAAFYHKQMMKELGSKSTSRTITYPENKKPQLPDPIDVAGIIEADTHEDVQEAPYGSKIRVQIYTYSRYITDSGDWWSFYTRRRSGQLASGKASTIKFNGKGNKESTTVRSLNKAIEDGILLDLEHEGRFSTKRGFVVTAVKRQVKPKDPNKAPFDVYDILSIEQAPEEE